MGGKLRGKKGEVRKKGRKLGERGGRKRGNKE